MIKISVIVPVYNAEDYLDECINSILSQTFSEFELLLINDGSSDKSKEICDSYTSNTNVKVFHKKNSGVSDTRNFGIEQATGKWLVFIDSDDIIEANMLEILYNSVTSNQADAAAIRAYRIRNKQIIFPKTAIVEQLVDNDSIKQSLLFAHGISSLFRNVHFTCVIYNTGIIRKYNIVFPKCKIGEDTIFCTEYLWHCSSLIVKNCVLYGYRYNSLSATSIFQPHYYEDVLSRKMFWDNLIDTLCATDIHIKRADSHFALNIYDSIIMQMLNPSFRDGTLKRDDFLHNFTIACEKLKPHISYLSIKRKIRLFLLRLSLTNDYTYHLLLMYINRKS
ncbi:MAG: glycosyltransferase family 2 protein [bacterium]